MNTSRRRPDLASKRSAGSHNPQRRMMSQKRPSATVKTPRRPTGRSREALSPLRHVLARHPGFALLAGIPCVAIRGRLGDHVFKTYGDTIVVTRAPRFEGYQPTAAQRQRRDKMRAATAFAHAIYANSAARALYVAAARKLGRQPFRLAVSDFMCGRVRFPLETFETGNRRWETGARDSETGNQKPETGNRWPRPKAYETRTQATGKRSGRMSHLLFSVSGLRSPVSQLRYPVSIHLCRAITFAAAARIRSRTSGGSITSTWPPARRMFCSRSAV
jgi:hypothetical protein